MQPGTRSTGCTAWCMLVVLGLRASLAADCLIRFTVSEAKSRVNISATVDALGLTGIGMKYVGDTPVYLSGSIYLAFPAATAASGPCRLPGGYEEFLAQLPSAWLHYPEGANPITVWPADFLLEVFGNKNYVEGMKVILEAAASGDPLTSANEWSPLLSVTVDEFQLKVRPSASLGSLVQDTDITLANLTGSLEGRPKFQVQKGEDGLVAIEAPMVAVFVLPRRENDPTSSTVKVALEMKVTAEATLGCTASCGQHARCQLGDGGLPGCECACGYSGPGCAQSVPCPEFRGGSVLLCEGSDGGSSPLLPGATLQPAPPSGSASPGECLDTQMASGWIKDEGEGTCRASGCECLPGFSGVGCAMCSNDEACQVLGARRGFSNALDAICDMSYAFPDRPPQAFQRYSMCTPKASEISSQMSFVQFSCWTNVTYNGIFTPPPLLEARVAEKGRDPVDPTKNMCFVETSLTFVDPPAPVLCTGYNCQLDRSGDVRCDGAVCDCLGTDGNCLALNPILDDVLGATIICSELPGDDCTVELPGSAVDPFTATCWASQCLLDANSTDVDQFSNVTGTGEEVSGRAVDAVLAWLGIGLLVVALFYVVTLAMLMKSSRDGKIHPASPSTTVNITLRFNNVRVEVDTRRHATHEAGTVYEETLSGLADGRKQSKRTILSDVSGELRSGTVTGLMGPSGSGKTTLLNVLMKRKSDMGKADVTGSVAMNRKPLPSWFPLVIGYVPQFEQLLAGLTCREIVTYSGTLRLPPGTSKAEVAEAVDHTLSLLSIDHVADSIVVPIAGSTSRRGISGGEKKRVAVAMELVARPQLLFLDECTSGLDSFLAESLMRSLKQYASMDAGRIVVATIHQPSAAIFSSLDQIICLSRGHLAYVGPPDEVEAFLSALGHQPAAKVTPAEAMLSLVSSQEVVGKIRRGEWGPRLQEVGALPTGRHTHVEEPQILSAGRPRRLVSKQLAVLTWRAMVIMARSPTLVLMHCVLGFVVGIGMGVVYLDVQKDISGIQNRNGAVFFCLIFFSLASLTTVDTIFIEREAVRSETIGGYYSPALYTIVKGLIDALLLRIMPAVLFCLPFYYLMGLNRSPGHVAVFIGVVSLFSTAVGWLSLFICTFSSTPGLANLTIIVVLLVSMLFGGLVANLETMPKAVSWLSYLSVFRYSFEALISSELDGETIIPTLNGIELDLQISGNSIIGSLGMEYSRLTMDIILLNVLALLFLGCAALSMWLKYSCSKSCGHTRAPAFPFNS